MKIYLAIFLLALVWWTAAYVIDYIRDNLHIKNPDIWLFATFLIPVAITIFFLIFIFNFIK